MGSINKIFKYEIYKQFVKKNHRTLCEIKSFRHVAITEIKPEAISRSL